MKIGIIGAGKIGGTVGALWVGAGHEICFGARHSDRLAALVKRLGGRASAAAPVEAARFGEVVFCAVPYGAWPVLAGEIAPQIAGKIVIDAANPYPNRDGAFAQTALDRGEGAGIPVSSLLPQARLVRAFSTVFAGTLEKEAHRSGDRIGIPLAGDDQNALQTVEALVRDAGFEPVIVGPLIRAREFDPGAPVYNTGMSGPEVARTLGVAAG